MRVCLLLLHMVRIFEVQELQRYFGHEAESPLTGTIGFIMHYDRLSYCRDTSHLQRVMPRTDKATEHCANRASKVRPIPTLHERSKYQ